MDEIILDMQKQLSYIIAYIDKQNVKDSDMLLSDYLINWLAVYRKNKVAPTTYYKDYLNIHSNILPYMGDISLKDLSTDILQKYMNQIEGDRKKEHIFVLLKHALRQAVDNKLIKENPMQNVILSNRIPRETKVFSPQDETQFFEIAKEYYSRYYDFFKILRYTGLRPCELYALCGTDITDKNIIVNKSLDALGNIKSPKTRAGIRVVPIFNDIQVLLEKYKNNDQRIFSLSRRAVEENFRKICKQANLQGYTLYSLRHTFITRCAEKGVHQKIVQKWAGHATLQMTLKFYTHISEEWEADQIQKLNVID